MLVERSKLRFNAHTGKRIEQIGCNSIAIAVEARSKTPPKAPADPFEDPLPTHIFAPLFASMKAIAVTLDRQPPSVCAFNHQIDGNSKRSDMCLDPVTAVQESLHEVLLEIGLACLQSF